MSTIVKKGEWVQIHNIVLKPEERTGKIPEETKKVPLELWVKGFLNEDAVIGDIVELTTITGRKASGTLVDVNPVYTHGFGDVFVPELLQVGLQVKGILKGEEK